MKLFLLFFLTVLSFSCTEIDDYLVVDYPNFSSEILTCTEEKTRIEASLSPDFSTHIVEMNESFQEDTESYEELRELNWQTSWAMSAGSPNAKKGGSFYTYIESFPSTFRDMGPGSDELSKKIFCKNISLLVRSQYDARFLPGVATHWAFGKDGKSVYYRLNPKARWSNGEPCTADDFVFALYFLKREEIASLPQVEDCSHLSIKKIGMNYLCITYNENLNPSPELLLDATNISPRPKHFYQQKEETNQDRDSFISLKNWVIEYNRRVEPTTYAYCLSEWDEHYGLIFKKVKDWWLEEEKHFKNVFNFDSIVLRILPGTQKSKKKYFSKGELDALPIENRSEYLDVLESPLFQSGFADLWQTQYNARVGLNAIVFNTESFPLNDINFRKALEYTIDIDGLIENVLQDYASRCSTMGKNETVDGILFNNNELKLPKYDKKKAIEILESAGFRVGKDGIRRNSKGEKASFTILYTDLNLKDVFGYLYAQALPCGIELDFRFVSGGMLDIIERGDFQAWWASFKSPTLPNHYYILHSNPKTKHPFMRLFRFSSPQLDTLLEQYNNRGLNIEEKALINKDIERIARENALFIPTYSSCTVKTLCWKYIRFPGWISYVLPYSDEALATLFCPFGWFDSQIKKEIEVALS